jgi:hypothetical protein
MTKVTPQVPALAGMTPLGFTPIAPQETPAMTIDITPRWSALVPMLSLVLQQTDSAQTRQEITLELTKMAMAADHWNAHCKEQMAVLEQSAIATATAPQTASQGGK